MMMIVIDGTDSVMGRVVSYAAKNAIRGEEVAIVNAEKIALSGKHDMVVAEYSRMRKIKDIANPLKGPTYPRRPDMFVKRSVQGMLPKNNRGRDALRMIKAYIGEPPEIKGKKLKMFESKSKHTTVEAVCRSLGWNG